MGSGNHVRTYLHRTVRNTLIELPPAWYAWKKAAPFGHESRLRHRSSAPSAEKSATTACSATNAYHVHSRRTRRCGRGARFHIALLPEGIVDCQRCHGPGVDHVRAAQAPNAKPEDLRRSIVNPNRLPAALAMKVCEQCHLETTSSPLPNAIRRFDRAPYSYRPGEPLSAFHPFSSITLRELAKDDKFEIVSSAYRLRKSQCFLRSKGALTCTTCHNPHDIPHGPIAEDHYNGVCRECHVAPSGPASHLPTSHQRSPGTASPATCRSGAQRT